MTETMSSADGLFGSIPARCCLATASLLTPSRVAEMVSLPNDSGRGLSLPNWFSRTVSVKGPRGRAGPSGRHIRRAGSRPVNAVPSVLRDLQGGRGRQVLPPLRPLSRRRAVPEVRLLGRLERHLPELGTRSREGRLAAPAGLVMPKWLGMDTVLSSRFDSRLGKADQRRRLPARVHEPGQEAV